MSIQKLEEILRRNRNPNISIKENENCPTLDLAKKLFVINDNWRKERNVLKNDRTHLVQNRHDE